MNQAPVAVFETLAFYNGRANAALADVLAPHEALCREEGTTYFGSVLGVLAHVLWADVLWLRRIASSPGTPLSEADISSTPPAAMSLDFSAPGRDLFTGLNDWRSRRAELDAYIQAAVATLDETKLNTSVSYRNTGGVAYEQALWQVLLHVFNHQTHHRGQVAQVLDSRGIDNDTSNLAWYLR